MEKQLIIKRQAEPSLDLEQLQVEVRPRMVQEEIPATHGLLEGVC